MAASSSFGAERNKLSPGNSFAYATAYDAFGTTWSVISFHVGKDATGEFWGIRLAEGGYERQITTGWAISRTCMEVQTVIDELRAFSLGANAFPVLQAMPRESLDQRAPGLDGSLYELTFRQTDAWTSLTLSQKEGALAKWYSELAGRLRPCLGERPDIVGETYRRVL